MKKNLRLVTEENVWRFEGNRRENYVGSFSHKAAAASSYILYELDNFDREYLSKFDLKLKPAEFVFRCDTDKSRLHGLKFLVKVNVLKGLVYFNAADQETENVEFETRGTYVTYLNLRRTFAEKNWHLFENAWYYETY